MPPRLGKVELRARRARSRGIDGIVREMPVDEGGYTKAQAIWVATQSRTDKTLGVVEVRFHQGPAVHGVVLVNET